MLPPFQTLAVLGAAAFAGVMLAISLILGAFWRTLPPAEFFFWFAANSGFIARTIPVVFVPTLVGLLGSLLLSWSDPAARILWLAALGCMAALWALTILFFFPLNAAFAAGTMPLDAVPGRLEAWLAVHWLRIALAFGAAALGILAVARRGG